MKKQLISKISLLTLVVLVLSSFCGCSFFETVNLDSEQSELVAEYAAGKLLQYQKGHENGIEQVKDLNFDELNPDYVPPEEENPEEPESTLVTNVEEQIPEDGDEEFLDGQDALVDEQAVPVVESPSKSIAEVLGNPNVVVNFDVAEICKKYPNDDSQLYLSMKATEGKVLLIAHFSIENLGAESTDFVTDSESFKVRISVNGGKKVRGDITLLDNDLMNYSKTIEPQGVEEGVFAFEIDEVTDISTLDLILIDNENTEIKYRLIG